MRTTKVDFKRELGDLYSARSTPTLIEIPELAFLMIDGHGAPASPDFAAAIQALYTISYAAKFATRRLPGGIDFTVMPLEALWWAKDISSFGLEDKSDWSWTAMIMQPEPVSGEIVERAMREVAAKKPLPALEHMRFETFREGHSAQVLHIGPYAQEAPTIASLDAFIAEHGYAPAGKHHEIYLSDPNRCAPEKLRTLIRHPVARVQVVAAR